MSVETIEKSKRLRDCADWLMKHGLYDHDRYDDYKELIQWAEDILSLIIPEPVKEDDTRTNL